MAYKCCCLGYKHSKWNKTGFYILYKEILLGKSYSLKKKKDFKSLHETGEYADSGESGTQIAGKRQIGPQKPIKNNQQLTSLHLQCFIQIY